VLLEHAVDGGTGGTVGFGQLSKAHALLPFPQDGSVIELERPATDVPASLTGRSD
jgi:hypothetical protein